MIRWLTDYIGKLTGEAKFSDNDVYLYLILIVSTACAGLMHVVLLFVMMVINLPFLAGINVISVTIYFLAIIRLIKKRQYTSAVVIIVAEVIIYILAVTLYIGTSHYIILYCFVILFIQLTIPYGNVKTRTLVSATIWISMILSLMIGFYHASMHVVLLPEHSMLLLMVNVNLSFGGVIVLIISSNMIRTTITKSSMARLESYKNQAYTDSLTGLYNRRYSDIFFSSVVKKEIEPGCVAMMDIDNFKDINDTWGHLVGDEVLCSISNILKKSLRKTDLVFRWGGEEFLLYLSNVDIEKSVKVLEKILKQIEDAYVIYGGETISVTVTIGGSMMDVNDVEASIKLCDERLYKGKNSGKNKVVFGDTPD